GVDYGERDTAIYNAEMIASMNLGIPVIYAGNVENQEEIRLIFEDTNYKLYITENVYPKIDLLNIEPTRRIIQSVFEEHITTAPGMKYIKEMVNENITPTPGAVMEASKLLYKNIGDLLTLDVGGATTDVHSVTDGSDYINKILVNPEPTAKRSVEGDLGVYVNMKNIVEVIGKENLQSELSIDIDAVIENYPPIPKSKEEILFVERLTKEAVVKAMLRHSGKIRNIYGTTGKVKIAEGKDLTEVRYIVGTGGALTRLPSRIEILDNMLKYNKNNELLFPKEKTKILIDNDYIMASMGVLSKKYEEASLKLLLKSLNFEEERLCILG
ncbi:MAG: glutamate mutase L, partial [Clostridioides difficile]|nr:glutamate mutase L [Clostridioides difficile]